MNTPPAPAPDDPPNVQVQVARQLVELSLQRSYMNTERTLAVWTRTALSLMIFGIAVDRFGLLLRHPPWHVGDARQLLPNPLSTLGGLILVLLGIAILLATGFRFLAYGLAWQRANARRVAYHTPWLAFSFAMAMALFGIVLAIVMVAYPQ